MKTAPPIHPSFPAVPEALAAQCARFLEAQGVRGRSEATIRSQEGSLRIFEGFLGGIDVETRPGRFPASPRARRAHPPRRCGKSCEGLAVE